MTDTTTQAAGDNTQAAGGTQSTDTTAQAAAPGDTTAQDATSTETTSTTTETPAEPVYNFTLPEGVELDATSTDEFKALAKELKLPPEAAQRIVDLEAKRLQDAAAVHLQMVNGWRESVVNDKEIGGDKLEENVAIAKKAVSLGPPELKDLLKQTGMDNHPTVFRWCLAVGKALSEDRMAQGGTAVNSQKTAAQVLYPSNS